MIFLILLFLTAILLSSVAAYYSVLGLVQIFPGAFWPIVIMGSVLELSKLVTASWLYRNWSSVPFLMRSYFTGAVLILMLITSMGIFGFLSSAHIQTMTTSATSSIQLSTLDQREKMLQSRMNFILKQSERPDGPTPQETRELRRLQRQLEDINTQQLPLRQTENKLMGEIGPIRYVAELLYDQSDPKFIDKAVRVVIILIILVFDPLAILLLIAANMNLQDRAFDKTGSRVLQSDVVIPKCDITMFH